MPDARLHLDPVGRQLVVELPVPEIVGAGARWVFDTAARPLRRLVWLTGDDLGPLHGMLVETSYHPSPAPGGYHRLHHLLGGLWQPGSDLPLQAPPRELPPSLAGRLPGGFTLPDHGGARHFDAVGRLRYQDTFTTPDATAALRQDAREPDLPAGLLLDGSLLPHWPDPSPLLHLPVTDSMGLRALGHLGDNTTPAGWELHLVDTFGQLLHGHTPYFDGTHLYFTDPTGQAHLITADLTTLIPAAGPGTVTAAQPSALPAPADLRLYREPAEAVPGREREGVGVGGAVSSVARSEWELWLGSPARSVNQPGREGEGVGGAVSSVARSEWELWLGSPARSVNQPGQDPEGPGNPAGSTGLSDWDPAWLDSPARSVNQPGRAPEGPGSPTGSIDLSGWDPAWLASPRPDSPPPDNPQPAQGTSAVPGEAGPPTPAPPRTPPASAVFGPTHERGAAVVGRLRDRLRWVPGTETNQTTSTNETNELARRLRIPPNRIYEWFQRNAWLESWRVRLSVLDKISAVEENWRLEPLGPGFGVTVGWREATVFFRPNGAFTEWATVLPGSGHSLRFKQTEDLPRLAARDGGPVPGGSVTRAPDGTLYVRVAGQEIWRVGPDRAVHAYQRPADSGPDAAHQLYAWSRDPDGPGAPDRPGRDTWKASLAFVQHTYPLLKEDSQLLAEMLGSSPKQLRELLAPENPGDPGDLLWWRVRVLHHLATQEVEGWRITSPSPSATEFDVVFDTGTSLRFDAGGQVVARRTDLPGSGLHLLSRPPGDPPTLRTASGLPASQQWQLLFGGDGGVRVGWRSPDGGGGPVWQVSAEGALESFTRPAGAAGTSLLDRIARSGVLGGAAGGGNAGHGTAGRGQGAAAEVARRLLDPVRRGTRTPFVPPSVGRAGGRVPSRLAPAGAPDADSGSRTPGMAGEGAGPPVPAGSSAPGRPAPPAAADVPGRDRTKESTHELLTRLNDNNKNDNNKAELARRLLISVEQLRTLLKGGGDEKVWLPRLSVLRKIAEVEADWRLVPTGDEGFAVAVRQGGSTAHFRPDGTFSHWVMALPGTGHRLRFDTPQSLPRLVGADGESGLPGEVVSADGGGLRVRHGDGEWTLDAQRVVRGYRRAAGSAPDPAQQLSQQLSAWSRDPGEPALGDWRNSLETIKKAHRITTRHDVARILGLDSTNLAAQVKKQTLGLQWRVRIAAFLTSQDIRNWRIETGQDVRSFRVVFGTGTTLTFHGGKVGGWRVDLPGTELQVHYDERGEARLATRDGGEPPVGWDLRSGEDGSVTVGQVPVAGGTGPWWRMSAGGTLESFTLPPAGPADPGAFARLTRAGVLDHPAPLTSPGAHPGAPLGVGPARPSPRPSDTGSGSRTPGPSRKRARPSAPAGPSAPDRPAPPAAADVPGRDRTKQIARELLTRLNDNNKTELARRLLTSPEQLRRLLEGGGRGVWLPRLSVLRKIPAEEADWRLVPTGSDGFAVAVRRGRSIAHFQPDGTFTHWMVALPGTEHRLRFDTPQGPPRLVGADGETGLPGEVVSADEGGLRVRHGDGEWTLDAQRVVRGYRRAAGSAPDPAQQLSQQLSAWSHNPGEPALGAWENSLETIKKAHRITTQHDVARILGLDRNKLPGQVEKPTPSFRWRMRIAAFLTSQNIRNWHIETGSAHQFLHVVFGTGTTLTVLGGKAVGWRVDLPGTELQVHYDERGEARLATRDGGEPPVGWDLRRADDGSVTVGQVPVAGGTGSWWRVSAGGTLESFTLPPAGPADPSAFARLTRAGVLGHPASHPEPVPAEAAPMALDSGLPDMGFPDMGFPDLEMPDPVAEDNPAPSYLHTLNWTDT